MFTVMTVNYLSGYGDVSNLIDIDRDFAQMSSGYDNHV